jgi:dTDP-4-amino-4,6-dideoxygalactose transaminase
MPEKYFHTEFGVNSRLDALQAGLLLLRLKKLDEWNEQRRVAARFYDEELHDIDGLKIPIVGEHRDHIYHLYILYSDSAKELQQFLQSNSIGSALYYPLSLHEQECFDKLSGWEKPTLPVAEDVAGKTIAIPCFPGITEGQTREVVDAIKEFFARKGVRQE